MGNSNECATYDYGIWDPDEAPDALEGETTPNAGIYLLLIIYMKGNIIVYHTQKKIWTVDNLMATNRHVMKMTRPGYSTNQVQIHYIGR